MTRQLGITASARRHSVGAARARMLAGLPLDERRVSLAGASTAVLEGGEGPPLILLHGESSAAARSGRRWSPGSPKVTASSSRTCPAWVSPARSPDWTPPSPAGFAAFVRELCDEQPTLVAHSLGGSLAARFAARHGDLLRRLVLYGAPGIGRYRMPIGLRAAAVRFALWPSERNAERFDRWAFFDFDEARCQDPEWFAAFSAYTRLRAPVPQVKQTMSQLLKAGTKQVADAELGRIKVPTVLLWGRQDRFVPLGLAEAASNNLGWPLHVIDDTGHVPHIERSDAFLDALQADRDAAGRS